MTDRGGPHDAENQAARVTGEVAIVADSPTFWDAVVTIYLEDVSYMDAAAIVVGRTVITGVRHERSHGETRVPFAVRADTGIVPETTKDYAVRAWLDLDGDGEVGPNDLYTDRSYRVLTSGFGCTVTMLLGPR